MIDDEPILSNPAENPAGASAPPVELVEAVAPPEVAVARELFLEYASALGFDLCFQGFEDELAALPGKYARPHGRLLLAHSGGRTAGCVALRPLESGVCEMKRLFVRPEFRGQGVGRLLVDRILEQARGIGYRFMRLDTAPWMSEAIALYRSRGFREIAPYCPNPIEGAMFFELDLAAEPRPGRGSTAG